MNDLNKKSVEELKKLEEESRAELFALRFQSAMGNLEKPHRIGELKKQIARILTILFSRKNAGENTAINVNINLSETYAKIEKESQAFAKQRKAKIDKMMSEQQASEDNMSSLMDLPLTEAMEITDEVDNVSPSVVAEVKKPAVVKEKVTKESLPTTASKPAAPAAEKAPKAPSQPSSKKGVTNESLTPVVKPAPVKPTPKAPSSAKAAPTASTKTTTVKSTPVKPAVDKKTAVKSSIKKNEPAAQPAKVGSKPPASATTNKTTVTVKSVTSAKAEIEVSKKTNKATGTNTAKKDVELNAKEKLAAMKSAIATGTVKGRGTGVKIDLDLKAKDPKASEYIYGANWKENRDKILNAGKTTKKADDKTIKKGTGKK
ncbi:50S ribosomal protein L29 [Spiroplasma endosymbiont of Stenodema calcarata]|uniref:50S ribosomal protein L29 n=1 Tax=Spiroplasma endosymbiont of Stenodema calcarata TaxID=3139328 RepID=UPI003CCAD1A4